MSAIDVEDLLAPLDGESSTGDDLEYDPDFAALERDAQPRAGQAVGDSEAAGQDIDWPDVRDQAIGLFARTKDLQVAIHLARALIRTDGWAGLGDSLKLVHGLLERYWESVHPRLDADSGGDATRRLNVLAWLCDPEQTLRPINEIPLVELRGVGSFNLRDIAVAGGSLTVPAGSDYKPPDPATIAGAFSDCDADELAATGAAIGAAASAVREIETLVDGAVGAGNGVNLAELGAVLRNAQQTLAPYLERRGLSGNAVEAAPTGDAEPAAAVRETPTGGAIRSRDDVVQALDRACEYYYRHEPSSPVPLLLRRAKRLVTMNFEEIIREIAPDGVSQVEKIRGEADPNGR